MARLHFLSQRVLLTHPYRATSTETLAHFVRISIVGRTIVRPTQSRRAPTMAHKILTISLFDSETAADDAAAALGDSGLVKHEAIGVLALDDKGKLKVDKVGARSTKKGAGIGAVLWVLGPVGVGVGLVGGGLIGALHHKGLGLDDDDQARISTELQGGRAAVGVLTEADEAAAVSDYLTQRGGKSETHEAPDEALDHAAAQPIS